MNTKIILFIALVCSTNMPAFPITVSKNTIVNIGKQTQVKITNFDLRNDGILIGDTASLLIFSNTKETKITGNNIFLASLKIAGNVICNIPVLTLNGDLVLQSGVMTIGVNRLIIHRDLLGETEKTYITASTGTIEKPINYLSARRPIDALGLEFTPMTDVYDIQIIRSHNSVMRTSRTSAVYSAKRVYDFSIPIDISTVRKKILPHEVANISKPEMFVHDFRDWKKVKSRNDEFSGASRIATFPPDVGLHFPKIITPKEVTNNTFEIVGLDEYPNARLIIMSKGGKILYDLYPYMNNFEGKDLPNGTYYYVFCEEYNSMPIQKSFFEIVR